MGPVIRKILTNLAAMVVAVVKKGEKKCAIIKRQKDFHKKTKILSFSSLKLLLVTPTILKKTNKNRPNT